MAAVNLYHVVAVDPISGMQVDRSDLHEWDELELIYQTYVEDHPNHYVMIVPVE